MTDHYGPRGHVLLVEGSRGIPRRRVSGGGTNLALLTKLTPDSLIPGLSGVDVVQVDDAVHPQPLVARLRAAGAHPGPVFVYLSGRLMFDRRGDLYVGLRDSTQGTVRYNGLPWSWLADALSSRPDGSTLVVVDLCSDSTSWARLRTSPALLGGLPMWGVVNHPDQPGADAGTTPFTRGLVEKIAAGFPRLAAEVWPAEVHADVMRAAAPRHEVFDFVPGPAGLPLVNRFPGAPAVVGGPAYSRDVASIRGASERGDHAAALALAVALDVHLTERHGDGHPDTLCAREVRAHVSVQAGRFAEAVELYRDVAERRADALGVDHPEVRAAADGAHAAWLRIDDEPTALRLAASVVAIRERIPGPDRGALTSARRRAARLSSPGPETLPRAS